MQEEYGIKLKILTDALKNSISQVKGMIHKFTSDIQKDNKINLGQMSVGNLYAEIGRAQQKIKEFNEEIAKNKKIGVDTTIAEGNVKRLNDFISAANQRLTEMGARRIDLTGLDKAKEKVKEVGDEAEDTKEKMSGISVSANMTNNTIVNGFNNSWKSIKKFAFSLLSIRGIYGLVRKASSAYMSQDTEMANQMQRTWASLGAMMAPIIERIVHWIRVAAAYINYFVKALTGKDLIGKAVKKINAYNKSLGGTAKAAKSVNKELTTMDEITNLTFDNTQGLDDAAQAFDDFGDIKLNENVTAVLDKWAAKLKEIWDSPAFKGIRNVLSDIVNWAIQHPGAVLTILGGTALLKTLGKLTGTGGLLSSLAGNLSTLAAIGIVTVGVTIIYTSIKKIIDAQNEYKETVETTGNVQSGATKIAMDFVNNNQKVVRSEKGVSDTTKKLNDSYLKFNKSITNQIKTTRKSYTWISKLDNSYMEVDRAITNLTDREKIQTWALYENYQQGKLTIDQAEEFEKYLEQQAKDYAELASKTKEGTIENELYNERLQELVTMFNNIHGKKYTPKLNLDTTNLNNGVKTATDVLNNIGKKTVTPKIDVDNRDAVRKASDFTTDLINIGKKVFKPELTLTVTTTEAANRIKNFVSTASKAMTFAGVTNAVKAATLASLLAAIPRYSFDVGTNYVPNDMIAQVHKGEAIVPKKFNDREFFNQSNEETNALLVEVNQNLIELRNRPNVLEVNGRELAQATYNDYQNEGNRLNQSMTIKRS